MSALDWTERILGWLALAAIALLTAVVLISMRRAQSRAAGRGAGALARLYRAPYLAVLAIAELALCVWLWQPIPLPLGEPLRIAALAGGAILYFGGTALALWGRIALGEMHNVSSTFGAQLFAGHRLITGGPYAWVRHPMYLGAILMGLGGLLIYHTWTLVLLAAHLPIFYFRARREETLLAAEFGDEWASYCQLVPGWVPRIGRRASEPGKVKPA